MRESCCSAQARLSLRLRRWQQRPPVLLLPTTNKFRDMISVDGERGKVSDKVESVGLAEGR